MYIMFLCFIAFLLYSLFLARFPNNSVSMFFGAIQWAAELLGILPLHACICVSVYGCLRACVKRTESSGLFCFQDFSLANSAKLVTICPSMCTDSTNNFSKLNHTILGHLFTLAVCVCVYQSSRSTRNPIAQNNSGTTWSIQTLHTNIFSSN